VLVAGIIATFCTVCPVTAAASADEEANLSEAQSQLDAASVRVAELEVRRGLLRGQVLNARRRANEMDALAGGAEAEAERVAGALAAERRRAAAAVRSGEDGRRQELHDWRLQRAWALAGAVFLFFIAFGSAMWSRIVAWLGLAWVRRRSRWLRATIVGLVALVGLGLIGASSTGVALIGGVLVGVSAAGLLFAFAIRPSEAREDGQAPPAQSLDAVRRGQIGLGISAAVGAVFLLVVVVALERPSAPVLSDRTLALAEAGDPLDNPTPELRDLLEIAERRGDSAYTASAQLVEAMRAVRRLNGRLGDARFTVNRSQRRVDRWEGAVAEPDPVSESLYVPDSSATAPESGSCDPNYSGCVPVYPPDVDCADVGGSVGVYGSDPHGLDADADGIGCE
jgi:multisubunit Na+/H+ antiporter MnhB subunit